MLDLKLARTLARLTQQQLAARAGVETATISRLERGIRSYEQAHYAAIVRIARDGLGVPTEELFPIDPIGEIDDADERGPQADERLRATHHHSRPMEGRT